MRNIRFRGKDKKTGKWVYGDLTHSKGINADGEQLTYDRVMVAGYEVEEDTIGQLTGVYDIHGKPVYEGDYIKYVGDDKSYCVKWCDYGFAIDCGEDGFYPLYHGRYEKVKGGEQ